MTLGNKMGLGYIRSAGYDMSIVSRRKEEEDG